MSYSDYLSKPQFGTVKEQSKPVSDWLASDEGHNWQNDAFQHTSQAHLSTGDNAGLFSIKNSLEESGPASIFPDDYQHPVNKQNHLAYEAEAYEAVQTNRRRAEEWVNEPVHVRKVYNDQRGMWE